MMRLTTLVLLVGVLTAATLVAVWGVSRLVDVAGPVTCYRGEPCAYLDSRVERVDGRLEAFVQVRHRGADRWVPAAELDGPFGQPNKVRQTSDLGRSGPVAAR